MDRRASSSRAATSNATHTTKGMAEKANMSDRLAPADLLHRGICHRGDRVVSGEDAPQVGGI